LQPSGVLDDASAKDLDDPPLPVLSKGGSYGRRSLKKGPQDRSRISTSEDHEVRYWSQKFGVSAEQLKAAVRKVRNSPKAVEKELKAGVAS
jgi:hypothetical protein